MISPSIDFGLNIVLTVVLVISIIFFIAKRKVSGKEMVPSICLFVVASINLIGLWFDVLGIVTSLLSFVFLAIGAYYTKFLPANSK
ncbi:MAG TPA: hypothetical protein VK111_05490 [Virgibacillus sp.]|nr:hypothetical protein [Virgibacillus sp.]